MAEQLHTGKGTAGQTMDISSGQQSALLSIDNDGPAKQISQVAPFVPPKPGMLAPEPGEPRPASPMDAAWGQLQKTLPKSVQEPKQVIEEEPKMETIGMEDYKLADEVELPEEVPTLPEEHEAEQSSALLAELEEQRKAYNKLEAKYKKATAKGAVAKLTQELEDAHEAVQVVVDENKVLHDVIRRTPKAQPTELKLPEWEGKDLRVCFPCYKYTNPATAFVLLALALDFGREKIGFIPGLGDARIANTRNRLADEFMKTGATWCLMIDDDMVPTIGRPDFIRKFIGVHPSEVSDKFLSVHAVDVLLKSGKKLVGATYFGRRKYSGAMFKDGLTPGTPYNKAKAVSGELLATDWVGTGCMLIHRDVFLGIQKTSPELAPADGRPFWDYFREGQGQTEGEDVMFCARAKKAGFQPFVHTGAHAFHIGYSSYSAFNTELITPAPQRSTPGGWPGGA